MVYTPRVPFQIFTTRYVDAYRFPFSEDEKHIYFKNNIRNKEVKSLFIAFNHIWNMWNNISILKIKRIDSLIYIGIRFEESVVLIDAESVSRFQNLHTFSAVSLCCLVNGLIYITICQPYVCSLNPKLFWL